MLLVAVSTIDWSALCWLEGNFCLLSTVRADNFVHCPRTTIRTTTHRPSTPPVTICDSGTGYCLITLRTDVPSRHVHSNRKTTSCVNARRSFLIDRQRLNPTRGERATHEFRSWQSLRFVGGAANNCQRPKDRARVLGTSLVCPRRENDLPSSIERIGESMVQDRP